MRKLLLLLIVSICIIQFSCTSRNQGNWMQFRGNNASGIVQQVVNPPIEFDKETNLHWKTEIPSGWSSPCILNNKIFLTGFDESDSLLYVFAVDRKNGEYLWKDTITPTGFFPIHALHSYASPTIASDGDRIFASFPNYGLLAYDLLGNKIWDYQHEMNTNYYYSGSSPIVIDSIIIQLVNTRENPRIVARNCDTGDSLWTIRTTDQQWSALRGSATPIIHDNLMILHLDQSIVAYNLLNQLPEWWLLTPTTGVGTPVIANNTLYVNTWVQGGEKTDRGGMHSFAELLNICDSNSNGTIEKEELKDDLLWFQRNEILGTPRSSMSYKRYFNLTDTDKNQSIDEQEWRVVLDFVSTYFQDHGMIALPLESTGERQVTAILWKVNKDTPETPSPLIVGENVVFIKDGGIMTVINRESGEIVHKERIGAAGAYLSSPILAGDKIVTCSYNGTVSIISAENFQVLGQNKLNEKIGASPTIVDDVLYIRTAEHLYAFKN